MYLTRIMLKAEEALHLGLIDAYALHQWLWQAFSNRDGEDRHFLSRTEVTREGHQTLLLSSEEPTPPRWGKWEKKRIAPSFLEHRTYLFDLRANPVVSKPVRPAGKDPRPRGKRQPILRSEELEAWINRKAEDAGFAIDGAHLEVGVPLPQTFRKKTRTGVHTRVDFRGVLTVRDRETFRAAFRRGIGPAKAFGFGMLMLRPI